MWKHARGAAGKGAAAVLISDTHFSHEKPSGRAGSPDDWYETMRAHLAEVLDEADRFGVPLVIAGDVFHTWDQPAELVNRVAEWLGVRPDVSVLMIPGQHDLPYHRMEDLHRSALHNLKLAAAGQRGGQPNVDILHADEPRRITYNDGSEFPDVFDWFVLGAGWGEGWDYGTHGAVPGARSAQVLLCAHQYVHAAGNHGHPGTRVGDAGDVYWPTMEKSLKGYAAAVFGDNHEPFEAGVAFDSYDMTVYNHGCLIRRTVKERAYTPEYGVLLLNGTIERHPLRAAGEDRWHDGEVEYSRPAADPPVGTSAPDRAFVQSVLELTADESVDTVSAINRLLGDSRLSKAARREILELLPGGS